MKWFKLQLGCTYLNRKNIREDEHIFAIRNEINLNKRRQNLTGEIINYHSQQRRDIVRSFIVLTEGYI
jgi:hypothetical protein